MRHDLADDWLEAGLSARVDNRIVEPRSDLPREQQKRIVLQTCEIDLFKSGNRVTLSKGDYHRLLRDPAQLQLFGIGRAWPHEHGVKRSLAQAGNERRRIGLLKREVDFGIRTAESADRRRYRGVERSRWGVAEVKRAGFAARRPSRIAPIFATIRAGWRLVVVMIDSRRE